MAVTERKAIDLSHHLSDLSRARSVSPLKGLQRYLSNPNLISLAGGLPAPEYFPFHQVEADILVSDSYSPDVQHHANASQPSSWFWKLLGMGPSGHAVKPEEKTTRVSIPKFAADREALNLAAALQYSMATGLLPLQRIIKEFTTKVYQPAYDDYDTLVHTGNTDGWSRCVLTFMNPGDCFLTESWAYVSALNTAKPYGIHPVPVGMDAEGMRSDNLRKLLAEWDESARCMKRPHVMYTVPIGQNPTGAVMGPERKKEIYDICVEYDVIIVEDDPYFFLQEGAYKPKAQRLVVASTRGTDVSDSEHYIASLSPSFLKIDYQGRVIRLDTFSKTVAPGCRLGWFTCNPVFSERLQRVGESSTQAPCGFGQSLVTALLQKWQYEGYIRWLRGLTAQYTARRDDLVDILAEEFDVQSAPTHAVGLWGGCDVFVASEKVFDSDTNEKRVFGRKKYFSFVPPSGGMFIWMKIHFDDHPAILAGQALPMDALEMKLWVALAEAGVLFSPGWFFNASSDEGTPTGAQVGHFRISFSNTEYAKMKEAIGIFHRVLVKFFE